MFYLFSPQCFQYDISSLDCSLLEPSRTRPLEHHRGLRLSQHRHVCVSKTLGKKVGEYGCPTQWVDLTFLSQRPL